MKLTNTFQILAKSATVHDFTIRKLSHTVYNADGPKRVDAPTNPKTGAYTKCDRSKGGVPDALASARRPHRTAHHGPLADNQDRPRLHGKRFPNVTVTVVADKAPANVRWEGELEDITSPGGRSVVSVEFVQRPEGQWIGTIFYFGTFSDTGLKDWVVRPAYDKGGNDKRKVNDPGQGLFVNNGLIQRWGALRGNSLADG